MQNFNLDNTKKNMLLQMAGKKLGTDPNTLREKLDSGQMGDVIDGLDENTKQQLTNVLQNQESMSKILGSEQVKNLLKNLGGNS